MAKECKVILRNQLVMVVLYGDKKIQMPTDNTNKQTVYVKKENGKYFLVDKLEEIKSNRNYNKKKEKEIEINSEENAEIDNSEL